MILSNNLYLYFYVLGPAVYQCRKECTSDTDILVGTSSFASYSKATGCNENTVSSYTNILYFTNWIKKTMNGT